MSSRQRKVHAETTKPKETKKHPPTNTHPHMTSSLGRKKERKAKEEESGYLLCLFSSEEEDEDEPLVRDRTRRVLLARRKADMVVQFGGRFEQRDPVYFALGSEGEEMDIWMFG